MTPQTYSPEEMLEALKRLGAEINEWPDAPAYRNVYHVNFRNPFFRKLRPEATLERAHEFLRTDESAWMAMDALFGESKLEQQEFNDHTEFHYEARGYKSHANSTRQAAVYDVFMQYIREELKK